VKPLGGPATVELLPEFEPGLLRGEKHSHFWVLAWLMGRPERDVLQVTPRGVSPDAPDATHGVFSVRSPARPNPIGLTAARLLRREGLLLHFDRLDFLDGTPVIDIKPYFISRDLIYAAHNASIGRSKDREGMRESLLMQAEHFCGLPVEGETLLAVDIIEHYRATILDLGEPPRWQIEAPWRRPALLMGLMALTRARLGDNLVLTDTPDRVLVNDFAVSLPPLSQ
jgi:tRNA-Thr(GGU) m(6)t(6)A37 methyltransferase TsaA